MMSSFEVQCHHGEYKKSQGAILGCSNGGMPFFLGEFRFHMENACSHMFQDANIELSSHCLAGKDIFTMNDAVDCNIYYYSLLYNITFIQHVLL